MARQQSTESKGMAARARYTGSAQVQSLLHAGAMLQLKVTFTKVPKISKNITDERLAKDTDHFKFYKNSEKTFQHKRVL
jgi:hypothetical protein